MTVTSIIHDPHFHCLPIFLFGVVSVSWILHARRSGQWPLQGNITCSRWGLASTMVSGLGRSFHEIFLNCRHVCVHVCDMCLSWGVFTYPQFTGSVTLFTLRHNLCHPCSTPWQVLSSSFVHILSFQQAHNNVHFFTCHYHKFSRSLKDYPDHHTRASSASTLAGCIVPLVAPVSSFSFRWSWLQTSPGCNCHHHFHITMLLHQLLPLWEISPFKKLWLLKESEECK